MIVVTWPSFDYYNHYDSVFSKRALPLGQSTAKSKYLDAALILIMIIVDCLLLVQCSRDTELAYKSHPSLVRSATIQTNLVAVVVVVEHVSRGALG